MAKSLISKLDYQRLNDRTGQAGTDANISRNQLINLTRKVLEATLTEPAKLPANV